MLDPFACIATAADSSNTLATLVCRDGGTIPALRKRLDEAIDLAWDDGAVTDVANRSGD